MKSNNMEFKAKDGYKNETVVKEYDDRRFTSIKGKLTDWLEKRTIAKAIDKAGLSAGAKLLDVPCGTGRLSIFLAGKGYEVTGTDISDAMVQLSQRKAELGRLSERAKFMQADAEKLPFDYNHFASVISLRLLGHVPPPIRLNMLKEFRRVASGKLILTFYDAASLQCKQRMAMRKSAGIPWYPVTSEGLSEELKQAGLQIIQIFPLLKGISESIMVVVE